MSTFCEEKKRTKHLKLLNGEYLGYQIQKSRAAVPLRHIQTGFFLQDRVTPINVV